MNITGNEEKDEDDLKKKINKIQIQRKNMKDT